MVQRIREAFAVDKKKLSGVVEVDEAYFGGKEANKHASKKLHAGRGVANKQPVFGMCERGGRVKAMSVDSTSKETLQRLIADNIRKGRTVYTYDHRSYQGLGSRKEFKHGVVNHSVSEYVKDMAHTNGIESMWAVLKRGYHGTFHHISAKYLHRYVDEFSYKLSGNADCQTDTIDRINSVIKSSIGKELSYIELT